MCTYTVCVCSSRSLLTGIKATLIHINLMERNNGKQIIYLFTCLVGITFYQTTFVLTNRILCFGKHVDILCFGNTLRFGNILRLI